MGGIFIFNRASNEDLDEEMRLGTPDTAEAKDLERHVDRCATRYRLFTKRLRLQGSQINRIELILYAIGIYALASVGPFHDFVMKVFFK